MNEVVGVKEEKKGKDKKEKDNFETKEFDLPNKFKFIVSKKNCVDIVKDFKKFI